MYARQTFYQLSYISSPKPGEEEAGIHRRQENVSEVRQSGGNLWHCNPPLLSSHACQVPSLRASLSSCISLNTVIPGIITYRL